MILAINTSSALTGWLLCKPPSSWLPEVVGVLWKIKARSCSWGLCREAQAGGRRNRLQRSTVNLSLSTFYNDFTSIFVMFYTIKGMAEKGRNDRLRESKSLERPVRKTLFQREFTIVGSRLRGSRWQHFSLWVEVNKHSSGRKPVL